MWYAIQTLSGEEEQTAKMIGKLIPSYFIEECFIPKRDRMKKFHGAWNKVEELLFPGYVFGITQKPEELYEELKKIPKMTKVLGRDREYFVPLNSQEERMVCGLGNKEHKTGISRIEVLDGKRIRVVDGPLKEYMGDVVKVDLHKREVVIRVDFMGRKMELKMGIDMVRI